nr:GFA family protein [Bradyrhizobium frederickii]
MKIDGKCHCGGITFEAEVDPTTVVICHCTDCQTLSGTAFRTVVPTKEGSCRLLSGAPKSYVKTGESGNRREQTFCPDCGTPIYSGPIGRHKSRKLAGRRYPPARSDGSDRPVLVSLGTDVAQHVADNKENGNTTGL